jgi:hypothetical protein
MTRVDHSTSPRRPKEISGLKLFNKYNRPGVVRSKVTGDAVVRGRGVDRNHLEMKL